MYVILSLGTLRNDEILLDTDYSLNTEMNLKKKYSENKKYIFYIICQNVNCK